MWALKFLLISFSMTKILTSCGGFKFIVRYSKNCDDKDQVIKMINSSIEINEKCEVMSRSCSMIKPYQKAIVETSVYKAGLQIFSKKSDLCDQKSKISDILKVGFGIFGIPMTCYYNSTPFFCYKNEKVVTFSESTMRLFQIFPVNGNQSVAKIKITHDEGTSCFETGSEMGEDRKKN